MVNYPAVRIHLCVRWSDIITEKVKAKVFRNYLWALILRVGKTAPLPELVRNNAWNADPVGMPFDIAISDRISSV